MHMRSAKNQAIDPGKGNSEMNERDPLLSVAFVAYQSIFPNLTNNRLMSYSAFLRSKEQNVRFFFLKGSDRSDEFPVKSTQSTLTHTPVIGYIWAMIRALCFFMVDRNDRIVYLYGPSALWWPLMLLWWLQGRRIVLERTELYMHARSRGLKNVVVNFLSRLDEYIRAFPMVIISLRQMDYFHRKAVQRVPRGQIACPELILIPPLVEGRFFGKYPGRESPNFTVGYLGTYAAKDNVEGIIEACNELKEEFPEIQVRLTGDVSESKKSDLLDRAKIPLYFAGPVKYTDLCENLLQCDLLISNRDASTFSQYGFPTKLVEYMNSGVPTIATETSDIGLYFKDEEELLLIPPSDHQALVDIMRKYYRNFSVYQTMGAKARESALRKFSAELYMDDWWNLVRGAYGVSRRSSRQSADS